MTVSPSERFGCLSGAARLMLSAGFYRPVAGCPKVNDVPLIRQSAFDANCAISDRVCANSARFARLHQASADLDMQ
ncbi:hypothetical protein [Paraburkholderia sp. SIMBA_030]|uniref:hypothetical protein n=1 Tax=Paraburkholderia sp. SIMBA_030 TaxID=3085773 RepID=UPI00397C764F